MNISYKAAYHLIDRFYPRKSLNDIIEDCKEYYDEALETALEIEDYKFMSVMNEKRELLNSNYVIFFNYKNELPTVLEKNKDLTLFAFAVLCVDCDDIPDTEFVETVHSQASNNLNEDPGRIEEIFLEHLKRIKDFYHLKSGKIRRNDPCPCGSNKKYKDCHWTG